MRVVFMGTPDYALCSLQSLLMAGHQVLAVFTQPDKPKGRGKLMVESPVKKLALEKGIPVHQPKRIRLESVEDLRAYQPDVCVTAAFGQILSQELLEIPRLGTVNVHASLLPAYRGSSPVHWAILNGETKTGVSTMLTDAGIDTGDILLQRETEIMPYETAGALIDRLAVMGAELLVETLTFLEKGNCPRKAQDEALASYYPMLQKEMGALDWTLPAVVLSRRICGLDPWPGCFTDSPNGRLRITQARPAEDTGDERPGQILQADSKQGLIIKTGQGKLRILRLQAPGGKVMAAEDYLRGHPLPQFGMMA